MKHVSSLAIAAAVALLSGCYAYPYPYYPYGAYPGTTIALPAPPSRDQMWSAAVAAATDVGMQVTQADRDAGRITGTHAGKPVVIDLRVQADNSLQAVFTTQGSTESTPTFGERWTTAYLRRMGR